MVYPVGLFVGFGMGMSAEFKTGDAAQSAIYRKNVRQRGAGRRVDEGTTVVQVAPAKYQFVDGVDGQRVVSQRRKLRLGPFDCGQDHTHPDMVQLIDEIRELHGFTRARRPKPGNGD
ncbi:MAG: hypothetical protein AB7P76_10245 [Candidatus Melainabacteria bacterium]